MKFSFSVQNRFGETLRVDGADSFDEAVTRVEKGLNDRDLQVGRRLHSVGLELPPDIRARLEAAGEIKPLPAQPEPAPAPAQAPAPEPKKEEKPAPAAEPQGTKPDMTQKLDAEGNEIKE